MNFYFTDLNSEFVDRICSNISCKELAANADKTEEETVLSWLGEYKPVYDMLYVTKTICTESVFLPAKLLS